MTEKRIKVDPKEFELPETIMSRDIDNRVFQGIVLQVMSKIEGVHLLENNLFDNLLGRSAAESGRSVVADQDNKTQTLSIKLEVNIEYGIPIPEKAEEIQTKVAEEITRLTGLHVSQVHVLFKNIIPPNSAKTYLTPYPTPANTIESDYNDEF